MACVTDPVTRSLRSTLFAVIRDAFEEYAPRRRVDLDLDTTSADGEEWVVRLRLDGQSHTHVISDRALEDRRYDDVLLAAKRWAMMLATPSISNCWVAGRWRRFKASAPLKWSTDA